MQISEFTFRLLLLFFPGVICAYLVDTLTIHRPRSNLQFLLNSLIFGLASYLSYWSALWVAAHFGVGHQQPLVFLRALTDATVPVSFREVAVATAVAVGIALVLTAVSTYKLHFRIAHKLRLTKKFGDLDVWGFVFNSPQVQWATIRDHGRNLVYDGAIRLFSDGLENPEILLDEVKVYKNDSGEHLYDVTSLYLCLKRDEIVIEFRSADLKSEGDHEQNSRRDRKEGGTEPSSV